MQHTGCAICRRVSLALYPRISPLYPHLAERISSCSDLQLTQLDALCSVASRLCRRRSVPCSSCLATSSVPAPSAAGRTCWSPHTQFQPAFSALRASTRCLCLAGAFARPQPGHEARAFPLVCFAGRRLRNRLRARLDRKAQLGEILIGHQLPARREGEWARGRADARASAAARMRRLSSALPSEPFHSALQVGRGEILARVDLRAEGTHLAPLGDSASRLLQ